MPGLVLAGRPLEVFRGMDVSLPQLDAQMVEVLHAVTLAEMPSDQVAAVAKLEKPEQRERLAKYAKMTVDAIAALMEFGYPKLARVDYAGDSPTVVDNSTMVVTLQITDQPPHLLNGGPQKQLEGHDGSRH
jgi:hypothetical protein